MKQLRFNNGDIMPNLGLGTWKSAPGEVYNAVKSAINIGYRHIDCAPIYGNEPEIGEALRDIFAKGDVSRKDIWITSKLWSNCHGSENVQPAIEKTLTDLQLDYLDLYLVHWPVTFKPHVIFPEKADDLLAPDAIPLSNTWLGMEGVKESGLSRHIGVSNFSSKKIDDLAQAVNVAPEANQVEIQPLLQQNELKDYCDRNNIILTAYSPLGSQDRLPAFKGKDEPSLFEHPVIVKIAGEHNCSTAQVLIRWALQRGTSVIPKSVNEERISQNFDTLNIVLTDSNMEEIAGMDRHFRYLNGSVFAMDGSPYSTASLWDE